MSGTLFFKYYLEKIACLLVDEFILCYFIDLIAYLIAVKLYTYIYNYADMIYYLSMVLIWDYRNFMELVLIWNFP